MINEIDKTLAGLTKKESERERERKKANTI